MIRTVKPQKPRFVLTILHTSRGFLLLCFCQFTVFEFLIEHGRSLYQHLQCSKAKSLTVDTVGLSFFRYKKALSGLFVIQYLTQKSSLQANRFIHKFACKINSGWKPFSTRTIENSIRTHCGFPPLYEIPHIRMCKILAPLLYSNPLNYSINNYYLCYFVN